MNSKGHKRIPVILDTDIGDDIDDTWALGMILRCPELDVRMVLSATENTPYRAKIIARFLEKAGRTDIAVGVGAHGKKGGAKERQKKWVADYELDSYPGTVYQDGLEAAAKIIANSSEPVTLLSIAPLGNVAELIARHPDLPAKTRFVGMHGSIDFGYEGKPGASAEWNVACDPDSAKKVFSTAWLSATITPLDSCGLVKLSGREYDAVKNSPKTIPRLILENYRHWADFSEFKEVEEMTTILYDTVATHLSYSSDYLKFETSGLRITDEGMTVRDPQSPPVRIAMSWNDLEGFRKNLVERLLADPIPD
ncbi:MAG: nucleoside hydrolase [Spirochaetia bacterium]|nr:nucleoside hydrolase [Spirochaetia bacterium]